MIDGGRGGWVGGWEGALLACVLCGCCVWVHYMYACVPMRACAWG